MRVKLASGKIQPRIRFWSANSLREKPRVVLTHIIVKLKNLMVNKAIIAIDPFEDQLKAGIFGQIRFTFLRRRNGVLYFS